MKLAHLQVIRVKKGHHVVGRAGWRRRGAIQVGRQKAAVAGDEEAYLRRWVPVQHGSAVIGANFAAKESGAIEHVESLIIGIGPNAHLRSVVELGIRES